MPSLSERIVPELALIEPGPERQRMLQEASFGQRTRVAVFLFVVSATGWFVLWYRLFASAPTNRLLYLLFMFCLACPGIGLWSMRRHTRRHLRVQLAKKGIPVCIPCGYNLKGNASGVCPECGTKIETS